MGVITNTGGEKMIDAILNKINEIKQEINKYKIPSSCFVLDNLKITKHDDLLWTGVLNSLRVYDINTSEEDLLHRVYCLVELYHQMKFSPKDKYVIYPELGKKTFDELNKTQARLDSYHKHQGLFDQAESFANFLKTLEDKNND